MSWEVHFAECRICPENIRRQQRLWLLIIDLDKTLSGTFVDVALAKTFNYLFSSYTLGVTPLLWFFYQVIKKSSHCSPILRQVFDPLRLRLQCTCTCSWPPNGIRRAKNKFKKSNVLVRRYFSGWTFFCHFQCCSLVNGLTTLETTDIYNYLPWPFHCAY